MTLLTRTTSNIQPASRAEIADLRLAVERELGESLVPASASSLLLKGAALTGFLKKFEVRGAQFVDVMPGKLDLGYLSRAVKFKSEFTTCKPCCADPIKAEEFAEQRFLFHGTSALAFNLMYGRWGIGANKLINAEANDVFGEVSPEALFLGRSAKSGQEESIANYARNSGDLFLKSNLGLSRQELDLAKVGVVLAIEVRGYGLLSNRLGLPYITKWMDWYEGAVCTPPKQFVHVLGTVANEEDITLPGGFRPE
jgi:hypothetical protein